ncbi:MAG: extracellular solute-binding protein [Pseudobutyrivibrio sp.]|uniref:ABC transporter substrate-binding protein n=1 Tax=unclassified Pseudobutyrivibrio TaxID=2638619 RepID=UPI00088C0079|nr:MULTISPECIES: ABC transporter substrate-binding protein [unclassified Pseudobutyrivibrio]MBE5904143.1 extracellular solute-binding protein [Pseudobutyrivibrio sp.]SCY17499.1 putative aldouronate transport system substrate-binding protein [Pseudobutyrivibrio sp. AR14]
MRKNSMKRVISAALAVTIVASMGVGCGKKGNSASNADKVDMENLAFPLAETVTITGTTSYPVGTEEDPNNRTIFKRLEEDTNVHVEWTAISSDQWADKITLNMSNASTLTDFVFSAGFSDNDLIRYADQGVIVPVEEYIDEYMPNLKAVFDAHPEYRTMCEDEDGHIWALPWIEQLGSEKTAIQTVGNNMPFINQKWLDFLGLETPTTVDEFEQVLLAFKEHSSELQKEFGIEGDIIPMSCIVNDQDPNLLINGFGDGIGDVDMGQHIAVTDDKQVVCTATTDGFKEGIQWLHKLYDEGLIDPECFTQDWSTYVAKGKSHRYGVCFTWDVANIDNINDYVPLAALQADTVNVTPQNGSFTSGFDRGRCVVTSVCTNPAFVCAWLDKMYDPFQSPQNNWGTYGEDDDFDIFELGTNANGDEMLKHAALGDASPVEVREAECVGGPLAILDEYYDVYVTCPDDAQYRLDWIKDYYTDDMHGKYVYPRVFMSAEDNEKLSTIQTDLVSYINSTRAEFIRDGITDASWKAYVDQVNSYGLEEYLAIYQKYLDDFYAK